MLHAVLPIPWWRLLTVGLSLVLLLVLGRALDLRIGRLSLVSSLRGTAQLIAVGYFLGALLSVRRFELVVATFLVMLGVAARAAVDRLRHRLPGLTLFASLALATGTVLGVVFMTAVVVQPSPWWDPQYVIPFAGMLLGNAMNGASLAGERFQEELKSRKGEVEARLSLGLSGPESVHPLLQRALRASLIPTLNSFAVAGVVQLPGMMTGQILSGVAPLIAVEYQILIFFLLMTSTAMSTLVFLLMLRSRYLTRAHQLRVELLR
ncbi:MAG TPA: iron export ABC transporter permease subunit FetB [Polyangiaceae bacterium]|jgi:putative ABC transport system permease protein|nr:iron export ABC transporter permease subunit FetB [Polyangiaceae bacterium]